MKHRDDAERDRDAGKATIAALVEALTPFVKELYTHSDKMPDRMVIDDYEGHGCKTYLTIGDLRRAARAVADASAGTGETK